MHAKTGSAATCGSAAFRYSSAVCGPGWYNGTNGQSAGRGPYRATRGRFRAPVAGGVSSGEDVDYGGASRPLRIGPADPRPRPPD